MDGTMTGWRDMFAYDAWANARVVEALEAARPAEDDALEATHPWRGGARQLAHLVAAQHVWLDRVEGGGPDRVLWPEWPREGGAGHAAEAAARWASALAAMEDGALGEEIHYRNSKGEPFATRLDRLLAHVVNHGTHHRAQAVAALQALDAPRPNTDYITWDRQRSR